MFDLTRRLWLGTATSAVTFACEKMLFADEKLNSSSIFEMAERRELFVDNTIVGHLAKAELQLHRPQPRERVLTFDRPWEGLYCGYETVVQDGDLLRMYYRGLPEPRHTLDTEVTCVAESKDGIHWTRPDVGAYEVRGTKKNNVVLARNRGCHNLAPFIDSNPSTPPEQRYKALGGTGRPGLLAFVSPDGLHWKQIQSNPVITKGAFDSQNNAFWSESEQQYVCYFRVFRDNKRWIARTTSKDFIHWTAPVDLDLGNNPRQHLYTNQFDAYFRAPHIYLGMPTRYFPGRRVVTDAEAEKIKTPKDWNYVNDCTDIALTSARGGTSFHRTFMEAFIRPGLDLRNWTSRANYAVRGMVQTGDHELSIYVKHNSGYPSIHVQRYTLRLDGFASIYADFGGGTMTTKLLTFAGNRLLLNYSTSAAGGLRVELRDHENKPIPGFSLADCREIIGDRIDKAVTWKGGGDVSELAGTPVRVHFELRDADLFSMKFD
jgi:hypothetical protein